LIYQNLITLAGKFMTVDNEDLFVFRDMVLRFLEQEVDPEFTSWEHSGLLPKNLWKKLGDAGMLCVDFPDKYGAADAGFDVALMIIEELAFKGYSGLSGGYNIHANIVAPYIQSLGTPEQCERWLPGMVSGDIVAAIAMTEPGAGSDLAALTTSAIRDDNGYILNGSKVFITNGIHADLVIVAAKTDPKAGAKGVSLFLVDAALPGFSRGKQIEKLGQHDSDTAELFFNDLRVPFDALLGTEGKGFSYLMQELPRERLGIAATAIGAARGALSITLEYVQQRSAFGQKIGSFQNSRFKLAEVKAELEVCTAYVEKCTTAYKRGEMTVEQAAIVKLAATEMQWKVVNECLQLFGGYGYTKEYPISRFFIDARVQTIYGGTSEIMKEVIARSLLGRL
jgi:acyl-CoA dehydrogenase